MQTQLLAVPAFRRQKAGQMNSRSRCRRLQPLGRLAQADGLNFTLDAPLTTGFKLLRLVPDQAFDDRHRGWSETQRLALDQRSSEFNAVQLRLNNQAAGAASATASAGAAGRTSIIDLDFSSFIIGDGSVTAFFILMVR